MLRKDLGKKILNTLLHTKGVSTEGGREQVLQNILATLGNPGSSATDPQANNFYKDPTHRITLINTKYEIKKGVTGGGSSRDPKNLSTQVPTDDELEIISTTSVDLEVQIQEVPETHYGIGLNTEHIKEQLEAIIDANLITGDFIFGGTDEIINFERDRFMTDFYEGLLKDTKIYNTGANTQADQVKYYPNKERNRCWNAQSQREYYLNEHNQVDYKEVIRYYPIYNPENYPITFFIQGFVCEQLLKETLYFPTEAYLGLFTTMPDSNGENFVEVPSQIVANGVIYSTAYRRMDLNEGIFSRSSVLTNSYKYGTGNGNNEVAAEEKAEDNPYKDYIGYGYVTNKEIIMFPEIVRRDDKGAIQNDDWDGWGNIVGFGLFEEKQGTVAPYFWGELEQPVPGEPNRVPLFRIKNFQLFLG